MPQQLAFDAAFPNYSVSTTLDGVPFVFDVYWNGRDGAWYFNLSEDNGTAIAMGIKIVLGVLLGRRATSENEPKGRLIACDLSGENREAGYDDLGERVVVFFYTTAELAAA